MARLDFGPALIRRMPPWLRRAVGAKLVGAIGDRIDEELDRSVAGVKLRFPTEAPDEGALATTGSERRIRRGPREPASTYARRIRRWWDDHKVRGGPYALLAQLDAFFEDWLNVRMDVVYASGTRRWIDAAVPGVVTRDAVAWSADGSGKWARFWLFFHLPLTIPGLAGDTLIAHAGDTLITQAGDTLVTDAAVSPGELSDEEREVFRAIPREWSAGHIDVVTVVLLWSTRRCWSYPQPVPTWSGWGASGAKWGEAPVLLPITD